MSLRNSALDYGTLSKVMHWVTAICFIAALPFGFLAGQIGTGNPDEDLKAVRDGYLFWHKSFGAVAFGVGIPRLVWYIVETRPVMPGYLADWEKFLATIGHAALYIILIGAPLTGLLLTQSAGHSFSVFGLFEFPRIFTFDAAVPPGQRWGVQAGALLHKVVFQYAVYAILFLHIAAVVKHVVFDKHPEMFQRMWFSSNQKHTGEENE